MDKAIKQQFFFGELNGEKKYAMKKFHFGKHEHFERERTFAQVENSHIATAVGWSTKSIQEDSTFSFL